MFSQGSVLAVKGVAFAPAVGALRMVDSAALLVGEILVHTDKTAIARYIRVFI